MTKSFSAFHTVCVWVLTNWAALHKQLSVRERGEKQRGIQAQSACFYLCISVCVMNSFLGLFFSECVDMKLIKWSSHQLWSSLLLGSCVWKAASGLTICSTASSLLFNTKLCPWQMVQLRLEWPCCPVMYSINCKRTLWITTLCLGGMDPTPL